MPKIIENLEIRIQQNAKQLFQTQGFEQTNMRQIAEQTQIAVGTLYRYYKDKEDLYLNILFESWKQTSDRLSSILQQTGDSKAVLQQMIETLIRDLQNHQPFNQLLREVARLHLNFSADKQSHQHESSHHQFGLLFSQALQKMNSGITSSDKQDFYNQLGSFIFIMAVDSCRQPEAQISQQAALISDIFSVYIKNHKPSDSSPNLPVKI